MCPYGARDFKRPRILFLFSYSTSHDNTTPMCNFFGFNINVMFLWHQLIIILMHLWISRMASSNGILIYRLLRLSRKVLNLALFSLFLLRNSGGTFIVGNISLFTLSFLTTFGFPPSSSTSSLSITLFHSLIGTSEAPPLNHSHVSSSHFFTQYLSLFQLPPQYHWVFFYSYWQLQILGYHFLDSKWYHYKGLLLV